MSSRRNASNNSKPPFEIPANDPTRPRWLLDLDDWTVRAYSGIQFNQDPNNREYGYGIISYTWGKYWNRTDTVPDQDAPGGIDWKIPRLAEGAISLDEAKKVISTTGKRYVWWDWMCVPQGGCHKEIAGQEIGKQMEIYRNAKASIIWLHDTNWAQPSDVRHFLRNHYPERPLRQWLQDFSTGLQRIREREPWLTSIWTLQEGVLLNHSRLVDRHGARLPDVPDDKRFHSDEATVVDLAIVPAKLARDIAMALLTGEGNPDPLFKDFTSVRENRVYVQQILSEVIRSGLFGYYDNPVPLTILAGKGGRRYDKATNPDQYWALIGALDLVVAPNYLFTIQRAREDFFEALLQKYQWKLLLAPSLPLDVSRRGWPEVIADGHILPLDELFFISELVDGLPHLSWSGTGTGGDDPIIIGGAGGAPFRVFRLSKTGYFRRYIQARNNEGQDLVDVVGPDTEAPIDDAKYLQIAKLQPKFGLAGKRCIEMRGYQRGGAGEFNGVVDLWVPEDDVAAVGMSRISLYLPQADLMGNRSVEVIIQITNQAATTQQFCVLYGKPQISGESSCSDTLLCIVGTAPWIQEGGSAIFTLEQKFYAVASITSYPLIEMASSIRQIQQKSVVLGKSPTTPDATLVNLTTKNGYPLWEHTVDSIVAQHGFGIHTDDSFEVPNSKHLHIGIGVEDPSGGNGKIPAALTLAQPSKTYRFTPSSAIYLCTGYYEQGQIVGVEHLGQVHVINPPEHAAENLVKLVYTKHGKFEPDC